MSRGQGDYGTIFKINPIGGTSYGFDQIAGIGIRYDTDKMIASKWREDPNIILSMKDIHMWQPPQVDELENVQRAPAPQNVRSEPQQAVPEYIRNEPQPEPQQAVPKHIVNEPQPESQPQQAAPEYIRNKPQQEPWGAMPEQRPQETPSVQPGAMENNTQSSSDSDEERRKQLIEEIKRAVEQEAEGTNMMPGSTEPQASGTRESNIPKPTTREPDIQNPDIRNPGIQNSDMQNPDTQESGAHTQSSAQPPEQNLRLHQQNIFPDDNWNTKWEELRKKSERVPLRLEQNGSWIKIDVKGIRELPKRNWYLGNNSFLLHGFFNYHYLLLGVEQEEGKNRWYLGIPGFYQQQERVMATIFGFPEFFPALGTEQFGYWIHTLDI